MNDDQGGTFWGWAIAKIASVWTVVGITSWNEAAAFVGFCYTLCLFCDWVWKKVRERVKALWARLFSA